MAVFIGIAGYRLGKRTIDTLMDAVPEGLADKIRGIADDVRGVVCCQFRAGAAEPATSIFADIEIGVARTLPLERVTSIKAAVRRPWRRRSPAPRVTVITTPRALDDETVLERVLHVAAVMRHPVHHVTVQHIGERLSVSLDLEVDGQMPLGRAHVIAIGTGAGHR